MPFLLALVLFIVIGIPALRRLWKNDYYPDNRYRHRAEEELRQERNQEKERQQQVEKENKESYERARIEQEKEKLRKQGY